MSKYLERITLPNITHMMSIVYFMTISMETLGIDSEQCLLEKQFIKLIYTNP